MGNNLPRLFANSMATLATFGHLTSNASQRQSLTGGGGGSRTDTLPKFTALPLATNTSNSLGISAIFLSSLPIFDPFEPGGGGLFALRFREIPPFGRD